MYHCFFNYLFNFFLTFFVMVLIIDILVINVLSGYYVKGPSEIPRQNCTNKSWNSTVKIICSES